MTRGNGGKMWRVGRSVGRGEGNVGKYGEVLKNVGRCGKVCWNVGKHGEVCLGCGERCWKCVGVERGEDKFG